MAGNRSTSLMGLASARNMETGWVVEPQPSVGAGVVRGSAEVFVNDHGRIIVSSLGLGLFFKKLLLPLGVTQLGVGFAYFLLHDKQLKVLRRNLLRLMVFGQRAHYLQVITEECRTDACHFQEVPSKLITEPGCGPRWRAFNSFSMKLVSGSFSPRAFSICPMGHLDSRRHY